MIFKIFFIIKKSRPPLGASGQNYKVFSIGIRPIDFDSLNYRYAFASTIASD